VKRLWFRPLSHLYQVRATAGDVDSFGPTVTKFENVRHTLVEYFGEDKDLREISEGDADDWRQSLIEQSAEATVSKLV